MKIEAKLIKVGNSTALTISSVLKQLTGFKTGDTVIIKATQNKLVVSKAEV